MRRGKPQQQLYRPGSGPLRKSLQGVEEDSYDLHYNKQLSRNEPSSHDHQLSNKLNDLSIRDDFRRKPRKPDQTFYVPKPIAQAIAAKDNPLDNKDADEYCNGNFGGSNEHLNSQNAKRYSNRRRQNDGADKNWRSNSPSTHRNDVRQASEPRMLPPQANTNTNRGMRDSRSVEPLNFQQKQFPAEKYHHPKPPSGRRHSSVGLEHEKRKQYIDALPPRFKRKFLEENKLNTNFIGTHSEGTWDGNSLVFQGSNQQPASPHMFPNYPAEMQQQHHSLNYPIQQHRQQDQVPINYQQMSYTLPRGGRGRAAYKHQDHGHPIGGSYRCTTPDQLYSNSSSSYAPTPSPLSPISNKTKSIENLHKNDSGHSGTPLQNYRNDRYDEDRDRDKYRGDRRNNRRTKSRERFDKREDRNTFREQKLPNRNFRPSLEAQLSPVSPVTPPNVEPTSSSITEHSNNKILDWSEEVELQGRLEEEALSDANTRSSSVTSLVDSSSISHVTPNTRKYNKRSGSKSRDNAGDQYLSKNLDGQYSNRKNAHSNVNNRDNFKVPESRPRRRTNSYDNRSRNASRESSFDRATSTHNEPENWREEILRSRHNSERECDFKDVDVKKAGVIVLPSKETENKNYVPSLNVERPKYPDIKKPISPGQNQKSLFDPNNPSKPIFVKSHSSRVQVPGFSENTEVTPPKLCTDQFGNVRPGWYDENSDGWKLCHFPALLRDVKKADHELQCINNSGLILVHWANVVNLRRFLMDSLEFLLCKNLKFCESENVEQHFWKILYYHIIEMMRNAIINDTANKQQYKDFVLWLIDEGTKYFENLLELLDKTYKFKINDYLGYRNLTPQKGLGYIGLALVSAQKIFLFLGDLGRYRELVNESANYGKCRQWYIKALEINPKNGKPFNQLAILAVYSRRKLDAVYYYMRSLMSTNPVPSAREYMNTLLDDNRKKYLQGERKRIDERLEKARQHMKAKESESTETPGRLRREIWIRPGGGRRVHITTTAVQEPKPLDSEEEDLAALTCSEVNKRFMISYLHVHGKLITKIGMETFQQASIQMLKEFRALLQHSPIPLNSNKLLQLLALNMFSIESTQLKDPQLQGTSGYRSEFQERAIVVSLQMFSLILERSVAILHEHIKDHPESVNKLTSTSLPQDFQTLLPPIKVWSDWMLCHSSVWNPPPSTLDYRVGPPGDVWSRLASLMNLLEKLDHSISDLFIAEPRDGYELVRLSEDTVLSGFTPLMYNEHEPSYGPTEVETEISQLALRLAKVLFFGTVFLCGLEPPVLKLEIDNDFSEYISIVCLSSNPDSSPSPPELIDDQDLLVESFSEDETDSEDVKPPMHENASSEVRQLLNRKVELEKRQRTQELHRQRVQKILQSSVVSVLIEICPKILIPDTNCFVDYLDMIKTIVEAHIYTLMVPLIVLNELEGLGRGGKSPAPTTRPVDSDPEHVLKVANSAKLALEYLGSRHYNIKCVTTKGTTLPTFTFTVEDDDSTLKNDDKILATCLTLCKNNKDHEAADGKPKELYREVVLLTEDRNLRVKALARDLPVRELPDFMQWAGLG